MGRNDPASSSHDVRWIRWRDQAAHGVVLPTSKRPRHPSPEEATQSNDIGMDQDGRLYLIDRWGAGMPILEYTG
jgi:hypothetical protein